MISEKLEKKLGVWGKDNIVRENNKVHAKDYYCVECYHNKNGRKLVQAEYLWPCMDPDIENYPYCKNCVEARQLSLLMEAKKIDEEDRK